MKFTIVSGSHRKNSQSSKVGHYIERRIQSLIKDSTVYFLDFAGNTIPLWDESIWEGAESWQRIWGPISKEISSSDAIVVIAPEWSGMAPGALRNFFHLCGGGELAHKPGLLVGVSSTLGGAYPVAELRMTSGKNTRICYIPDHVIVRNVEKVLEAPEPASDEDAYIRRRIDYSVKVLAEYGKALRQVRESGVVDTKAFPFGM